MKIGDTIKLIPKTRHGKNRAREHGNTASVVHMRSGSFCVETPDKDWRWVDNDNDKDFDWELIGE